MTARRQCSVGPCRPPPPVTTPILVYLYVAGDQSLRATVIVPASKLSRRDPIMQRSSGCQQLAGLLLYLVYIHEQLVEERAGVEREAARGRCASSKARARRRAGCGARRRARRRARHRARHRESGGGVSCYRPRIRTYRRVGGCTSSHTVCLSLSLLAGLDWRCGAVGRPGPPGDSPRRGRALRRTPTCHVTSHGPRHARHDRPCSM